MSSVLITGGSSGIGAALVRRAAGAGWQVAFTYKTHPGEAQKLVQELSSHAVRALPLDLNVPETITACVGGLAKDGGTLDAIVLSAAPGPSVNPLWKETDASFLEQFSANVIGNRNLLAACWKTFFRNQSKGHVVALLSLAMGPPPSAQMASYIIGKRALQTLLECALVEYGPSGLRASAVIPTFTETPMLGNFHTHFLEMARQKSPSGSFLSAEHVAEQIFRCLEEPPTTTELALRAVSFPTTIS